MYFNVAKTHANHFVATFCIVDLVVSVLAFYSDDPSSNPSDVYDFYSVKMT